MKKAKSFGVRGMNAEERAAANPYLGTKVPIGGVASNYSVNSVDENLRSFMLMVYNYMFIGMLVTAAVAFLTYSLTVTGDVNLAFADASGAVYEINKSEYLTPLGVTLWTTSLSYVVGLGPLMVLIFCAPVFRGLNPAAAFAVFMVVAVLIGVSFSGLALTYTDASLVRVFCCTAAAFGGLSLIGYTTRQDLSGWGSFLWMGLFGLIAACIVNLFMDSNVMQFAICSVGVIVFSGFTVYDTQMIKEAYSEQLSEDEAKSIAISGALDLYLDFVNLFRFLLYFLGTEE